MISVIVSAYNEEKNIAASLSKLRQNFKGEIIVVDDGSTDNTVRIASKYARVASHEKNLGKGAAMRTGAKFARGEKIIFLDADQNDPGIIKKFENALEGCDIVIGVRDFNNVPWPRRINNALSRLALFLGTGKSVRDPLTGVRAVRKKDFLALGTLQNRFEIESEINFKILRKKLKIRYVPITIKYEKQFHFNKLGISASFRLAAYLVKSVVACWLGAFK